jgi:hypothetical protein
MLPLPPPAMSTTVPTPQQPSSLHPSVVYGQSSQVPITESTAPTPWWMWFVGGAVAVGLGIAGAVWYAGRGEAPVDPPNTTTLVAPTPKSPGPALDPVPANAQIVPLRFDSMPRAGVFAEGHSAELCRTPCSIDVNLADGGPQDHRKFIVHADGYKDNAIEVDLASPQREYSVTLEQLEPLLPRPVSPEAPESAVAAKHPGKAGKLTHVKKTEPDKATDKVPDKTAEPPIEDRTPEVVKPVEVKKPDVKKPAGKIDSTETLDPFHRHTP